MKLKRKLQAMVHSGNMWDPRKNNDYVYIDNIISEYFNKGGVGIYFHKYIGIYDQGNTTDFTQPGSVKNKKKGILQIQDLFFKENRDRHYDESPYEIKCIYDMQDSEFNLAQFGLFLDNDTLYLEFHLNDILKKIGRKPLTGDVIEMPHLRDDAILDESKPAFNKFYSVEEVTRSAKGFDILWRSHLLRVKVKPMTNSQEYQDILDRQHEESTFSVRDVISNMDILLDISKDIEKEAHNQVPYRNFQTEHLFVVDGNDSGNDYPWLWAGDGIPPNGAQLLGKGKDLPVNGVDDQWFLCTSQDPPVLYQFKNCTWRPREVDYRMKWQAAHRILESFINNNEISVVTSEDNTENSIIKEKQFINKVVRPRADF